MKFRRLMADEIDCRAQSVKKNGLVLLLYKDARCDMNILDETVGAENWQRHHSRDNANCIVSIWDDAKGQWVEKEDTGTESNTEKEKGLASDSFKRACFNWGIGRELYTAPFIWINSKDCSIVEAGIYNGKIKYACYDSFSVESIGYDEAGCINALTIKNDKTNRVVYKMGRPMPPAEDLSEKPVTELEKKTLKDHCEMLGVKFSDIAKQAGWKKGMEWNAEIHGRACIILKEIEEANGQ